MKIVTRFQGGEVFKRQICQIRIFASRPDSYFRPTFAQSTIHFRKYTKLSKCFVATLFINAWLTVRRDMCHLGCVVSSVSIYHCIDTCIDKQFQLEKKTQIKTPQGGKKTTKIALVSPCTVSKTEISFCIFCNLPVCADISVK